MKQEMVTISIEEYEKLKIKAELADDALLQLKIGLEDLQYRRVTEFNAKSL